MKRNVGIYRTAVLLATLGAAFGSGVQQYASSADVSSGVVGCRFNEALCPIDESCVYDGLFGNCQKTHNVFPDLYQYDLSNDQRHELESILLELIGSGYTWSHDYTQCVITSILVAYRRGGDVDVEFCNAKLRWYDAGDQADGDSPDWQPEFEYGNERSAAAGGGEADYLYGPADESQPADADLPPVDYMGDGVKRFGDVSDADSHETAEEFDDYLKALSRSELESLKKYVVDVDDQAAGEEYGEPMENGRTGPYEDIPTYQLTNTDYAGIPVEYDDAMIHKKDIERNLNKVSRLEPEQPAMMTRVVVNYDPGDETDAENNGSENEGEYNDDVNKQPVEDANVNVETFNSTPEPVKQQQQQQQPVSQPPPIDDAMASQLASVAAFGGGYGAGGNGIVAERIDQSKLAGGRVGQKYLVTMYILCGLVGGITLAAITIYLVRRRSRLQEKLAQWVTVGQQPASEEYQDLCRQHMQAKFSEKSEPPVHPTSRVEAVAAVEEKAARTGSTGSSTSSWSEEPVSSNLDISTGHIVLSYMEDHLRNKDRLQKEWDTLCAYDAEPCSVVAAIEPTNMRKNRFSDILPYEHSRVRLSQSSNVSNSDYINASTIMDHDPRNPAYIATQGPLPHTVADFWQMVWEQGSIVIVNLTRLTENSVTVCHRYWPEEGSDLYHIYEVHLVSEHVWCEDYIIRSFYLKNLQTNETRTVTQFHFIAWPNNEVPHSVKSMLDFRRKVNKSFRCRSSPVIVHCSDGAGRTGTYCLIDMVLNRLSKGAKEIDIAATLEHIRDQRVNMVRTKEQFEFALTAVAQEVQAILHAPTQ